MLRGFTAFCLIMSGLCAMTVEKFGQSLCLYEYMAPETHSKLKDIFIDYSTHQDLMFIAGMVVFIAGVSLYFLSGKITVSVIVFLAVAVQSLILGRIDSLDFGKVIADSSIHCSNLSALGWFVFQGLAILFSAAYVCKFDVNNKK